jgi:hypothetical protein
MIVPGEAFSVTVGVAGGVLALDWAAGVLLATCFWQPERTNIPAIPASIAMCLASLFLIISSNEFGCEFCGIWNSVQMVGVL